MKRQDKITEYVTQACNTVIDGNILVKYFVCTLNILIIHDRHNGV